MYLLMLLAFVPALIFSDEGAGAQNPMLQTIIMLLILGVFFYFIMWRPEKKRRQQMQSLRDSMKPGDRVTAMGIIGKVSKVEDKTVILEMVDGAKVEFLKAAVTDVEHTS